MSAEWQRLYTQTEAATNARERRAAAVALYRAGAPLELIARACGGVTRERIRAILKKARVPLVEGRK